MRIPRDWSGDELIKRLGRVGYVVIRQSGSHVRMTRTTVGGDHHVTIPLHSPLRLGTLNAILTDVAEHLGTSKETVLQQLL